MKKKVKMFLAIGEDLHDESLELADLVEHLNLILEPQDIHIYLTKWDYLTESVTENPVSTYDTILSDCEICMVVFGKDFGSFAESDLRAAYERVCREGVNPEKLYVYFKNTENLTEELRRFRNSFPEVYGHFTGNFSDINMLKNDFLLQFQLFQSRYLQNACPVEVENAKVKIFGKDLFIDLMQIPFLGNNKAYTKLLKNIKKTKKWLSKSDPEDEEYAELASDLHELEEDRDQMEKSIWSTAVDIARLSNMKCSERLKMAIEKLNAGDNIGAAAILDTEDILKDAEHNLQMKRLHEEGLKTNIEELKLKIKTIENEMAEGWREEILQLHQKVMEYTKEAYGQMSEEYITSLLKGGQIYYSLSAYTQAIKLQEEALSLSLKLFGAEHTMTANIYSELSISYLEKGNLDKAKEYALKTLDLDIKLLGRHPFTATAFNNLGVIYEKVGESQLGLECCEKALEIRRATLGEMDPLIANSLSNIARAYEEMEKYDDALEYAIQALDIRLKLFGEWHPETAISFNNVGITYGYMGNPEKELEYFHKALEINLRVYGKLHSSTANAMSNLGITYAEHGNLEKGIELEREALELRLKIFGEDHLGNLLHFYYLAEYYGEQKDYPKGIEYLNKALQMEISTHGEENSDSIECLYDIGWFYYGLGNYQKAVEYIERAAEITIRLENFEAAAFYIKDLGRIYSKIGETVTAMAKFEEAMSLLPEDHPEAIDLKERLEVLKKRL